MPAVLNGASPRCSEEMWQALRKHIIRERERKKQEQEADAEEERQRKERERQQKQDVMTIGETRDQIASLESELAQLKDEKHQLFLQLKKVLNEDDNRRRQLIKESSVCPEIKPAVTGYFDPETGLLVPHLLVPIPKTNSYYKVAVPMSNPITNGPVKRSHSPSPPPPASPYHSSYYKPSSSVPTFTPPSSKSEEAARRSGDSRAILWNKNNYPVSTYYSAPSSQSVYNYSTPKSQASKEAEAGKPIYISSRTPLPSTHQPAYVTNLHPMEHKGPYQDDKFYSRPANHVTVHGGAIPIQQPPQGAKPGGITSGYPVRTPQPPPPPGSYPGPTPTQQVSYVTVGGVNVSSGRMLYTQCSPLYLPREV